jgi:hypothetical protein
MPGSELTPQVQTPWVRIDPRRRLIAPASSSARHRTRRRVVQPKYALSSRLRLNPRAVSCRANPVRQTIATLRHSPTCITGAVTPFAVDSIRKLADERCRRCGRTRRVHKRLGKPRGPIEGGFPHRPPASCQDRRARFPMTLNGGAPRREVTSQRRQGERRSCRSFRNKSHGQRASRSPARWRKRF